MNVVGFDSKKTNTFPSRKKGTARVIEFPFREYVTAKKLHPNYPFSVREILLTNRAVEAVIAAKRTDKAFKKRK